MKHKNKTRFLACLLCIILVLSGCGGSQSTPAETAAPTETTGDAAVPAENETPAEVSAEPSAETAVVLNLVGPGNTSSNLLEGGVAAEYEGYIYHTDRMMWGNIWRTPTGGGDSELIQTGKFHGLNINDGVIFALGSILNPETGFYDEGIYMMNTDGSNLKMIKEGWFEELILLDEYLYYSDFVDGKLNRMKYDGSEETLLLDNFYNDFVIIGGSLYVCAELGEEYAQNVYKMPLDGNGEPEMVISDFFGGGIYAANECIYFIGRDNTSNTYQYNTETGETSVFLPKWIDDINTDGEYIYYFWTGVMMSNSDKGFYRIRPDGSEDQLIMQVETFFSPNIAGGKVFWHNNDEQRRLSVMNLNGSDLAFVEQAPN
ncbi:MAG: DUF5050 domain-containing protein [Clostridia bacterium]|nr:DUF5050 domain-containing protein [Clostridia bacterium]